MIKRITSILLILILLFSLSYLTVFATDDVDFFEDNDYEDVEEEEESTEAPTEKPTELPLNLTNYKPADYLAKLEKLAYNGDLGCIYSASESQFVLWAPTATAVSICVYTTGSDSEDGAEINGIVPMEFDKSTGTWSTTLNGDWNGYYYTYRVTVEGKTNEVVDPYAKAVGVNGDRAMIIDLSQTNPDGWYDETFTRVDKQTDAVIWEVSVKDFSSSDTSGVRDEYRGKFMAFTEEGTKVNSVEGEVSTCVEYLKELGVNYVQINPFYDFASVDETKLDNDEYNWGYDPKNYNAPEGSYSTNPYDGAVRIKECKEMINALHKAGIGVVMDVVYNHTYEGENSNFNKIVPNYYYRISDNGTWSNGSGCGNDMATERAMYRKFIVDSVTYWAYEYHIDGFRFDLMGLYDVDTMNEVRDALDLVQNGQKIIMIGEAWDLKTDVKSDVKLANQNNMSLLSDRIAAFNDTFRDGVRGSRTDNFEPGFIEGGSSKSKVKSGIEGMCLGDWANSPSQCVNYVSCHDDLTLYDKLVKVEKMVDKYDTRYEDLVSENKLSASLLLTSQGIPFMLAGEEMGRTKKGDNNSYNSGIEINEINWSNVAKYRELVDYYKGLIEIRKNLGVFSAFTDDTKENAENIIYYKDLKDGLIGYVLNFGEDKEYKLICLFNGSDRDEDFDIGTDDTFIRLNDENIASFEEIETINNSKVKLKAKSSAILLSEDCFEMYKKNDKYDTEKYDRVFVNYLEIGSQSIVHQQIVKGLENEDYSISTPTDLLTNYDLVGKDEVVTGTFSEPIKKITVNCSKYKGSFGTVTIKFLDEQGNQLRSSLVMKNRSGQQYFTPKILSIHDYSLNLDKLPNNGAGKFNSSNIDVKYIYKEMTEEEKLNIKNATKYNSKANIIYLGSDGRILDKKSYMGVKGDPIEIQYTSFDNYQIVYQADDTYLFNDDETNVVITYQKIESQLKYIIIVVIAIIVLTVIVVLIINYFSKKKIKSSEIYIDE